MFVALIVLTFAWLLLAHLFIVVAIRCPSCKRRVGWFVMMTAGKQWLAELWRGGSCPACGATGR